MAEEFINDRADAAPPPESLLLSQRDRESVQVMLIGSQRGIQNLIYTLFYLKFAEVYEWSRPQRDPKQGKFISVMTKYLWFID